MRGSVAKIKLKIPAGSATMGGAIAPALGQKGVKAKEFCDQFNEKTKTLQKGIEVYTTIYVMKDKSFKFKFNTQSVFDRIKAIVNSKKGSQTPGRSFIGSITMDQVRKIAEEKINDSYTDNIESMIKTVIGTAKTIGVEVK